MPLEREEMSRLWKDLRTRYPNDDAGSTAARLAWRKKELRDCVGELNFSAAEYHYWWLIAEADRKPPNEKERKR